MEIQVRQILVRNLSEWLSQKVGQAHRDLS